MAIFNSYVKVPEGTIFQKHQSPIKCWSNPPTRSPYTLFQWVYKSSSTKVPQEACWDDFQQSYPTYICITSHLQRPISTPTRPPDVGGRRLLPISAAARGLRGGGAGSGHLQLRALALWPCRDGGGQLCGAGARPKSGGFYGF